MTAVVIQQKTTVYNQNHCLTTSLINQNKHNWYTKAVAEKGCLITCLILKDYLKYKFFLICNKFILEIISYVSSIYMWNIILNKISLDLNFYWNIYVIKFKWMFICFLLFLLSVTRVFRFRLRFYVTLNRK